MVDSQIDRSAHDRRRRRQLLLLLLLLLLFHRLPLSRSPGGTTAARYTHGPTVGGDDGERPLQWWRQRMEYLP